MIIKRREIVTMIRDITKKLSGRFFFNLELHAIEVPSRSYLIVGLNM